MTANDILKMDGIQLLAFDGAYIARVLLEGAKAEIDAIIEECEEGGD